jgi:L-ascorbate metabolism protein UlaG (beta-lactamase superfamily)
MFKKNILVLFTIVLFSSCSNPIKKIEFAAPHHFDENKSSEKLEVEFNGVACFYFKYKNQAILTDPFMSNPSALKVGAGKLITDEKLLNSYQPKMSNIKLISVAHAHYDHIMDLPYYLNRIDNNIPVVGDINTYQMVKAGKFKNPVFDISQKKANVDNVGEWYYTEDRKIRVLPIKSYHLPHIFCIKLYHGPIKKELKSFPNKSKQFMENETMAYIYDFLDDDGKPEKRIYFSSSCAAFSDGFFPKEILAEKSIDVAVLPLALSKKAEGFPEDIIKFLAPKDIIYCHWENFFRDRTKPLKPVSMSNIPRVLQKIENLKDVSKMHFIKPGNSWMES